MHRLAAGLMIVMGTVVSTMAMALPPTEHMALPNSSSQRMTGLHMATPQTAVDRFEQTARTAGTAVAPAAHLDLRAPADEGWQGSPANGSRGMFQPRAATETSDPRLRGIGAAYDSAAKSESMEHYVRQVRHQGLPVAKLWENKSALVSIGLNGRGKPGIWLVQKIR